MPRITGRRIYRVLFQSQGKLYEVYARKVVQSDLPGFIVIEDLVFGERGGLLVDPAEERLRSEFSDVRRSLVPFHAVIRIDEVDKEGVGKLTTSEGGSNVASFPGLPPLPRD
ncbi:hypothetical protein EV699_11019 [Plasticicumulans lactativorans]|uniref:DUF1820 family protein n=1 Tax=Plasticicumulans lactativorans TaxID=1133106 RepID=A0A4R2L3B4_9GAMM|nr:DUF1820 family protein [Plasticicumulans lactativorans]TCO80994.1 hypothetical protein EV699_11019 [Plasticicumulans lactativorans]